MFAYHKVAKWSVASRREADSLKEKKKIFQVTMRDWGYSDYCETFLFNSPVLSFGSCYKHLLPISPSPLVSDTDIKRCYMAMDPTKKSNLLNDMVKIYVLFQLCPILRFKKFISLVFEIPCSLICFLSWEFRDLGVYILFSVAIMRY